MNNPNNSLAFTRLKPLLVNFLKCGTIENVTEIENAVQSLDPDSVETLQEYILLPFLVYQNTNQSEKITIKCINFVTFMFKRIKLKSWKFFCDTFNVLVSKISDMKDLNNSSCVSEELKLSVCECVLNLICCSSEEILNEVYSLTFRPQLAHIFVVLSAMVRHEKSKTLLKATLEVMGALTYSDVYLKSNKYEKTELIASEALASCLPGLSVTLLKIITGDDKQAHSIIVMALDILSNLIILTVGDASFERGIANDSSSEIHHIAYKSGKFCDLKESSLIDSIPIVLKTEAWFKSVAENLEILIKQITVVSSHNHFKVRYYLLKFSEALLNNCSKTLQNCIPILLPVIFGLSVDNNALVSSSSKNVLFSLSEKFQNMSSTPFNKTVEDNIEALVNEMIKCKLSANDDKKLTILKSLLGYIEISHLSLNKLIFSAVFLKKIIFTLLTLLEFDVSDLKIIEELPTVDSFDMSPHLLWPKKKFNFFENEEVLNTICKLCYSLGLIGNARVIVEYLLEKLSSSDDPHTLQCIFVIGSIIKGFSKESSTEKYTSLVSDALEIFLSSDYFDVPLSNNDELDAQASFKSDLTHNILNKNQLQICLILEAIANCSECLKTEFKIHLMTVLCPVMEKAGSSNYIISECGRLCLESIAKFCQYASIRELIKDNADYITNLIMINFHGYLLKPEIAVVLHVVMDHSDAEAIVLFRDFIFEMLDVLDYNQDQAYLLLCVLLSVARCIKKLFPCKKDISAISNSKNTGTHQTLKKAVKDYLILKKIDFNSELESCSEDCNEEILANPVEDDYGVDEKKPEIPLHINIICEIFKRCIHLQSSENRYVRMLTLEIVEVCISALSDYEKELLPLVHEFWSPFLRRFTEDTFVPKAFSILLLIANECGDFIRSRAFKEVMPKIVQFLQQEYSKSHLRCFRQYEWTSNHSLQTLLLSEIGNLCTKLDINDKEFHTVVTVCLSYLKKEQPKVLQEAAAKSLKMLSVIDPDAIWFYWNVAYSKDDVLNPPHESLLTLTFPYCDNSSTSFDVDFKNKN